MRRHNVKRKEEEKKKKKKKNGKNGDIEGEMVE